MGAGFLGAGLTITIIAVIHLRSHSARLLDVYKRRSLQTGWRKRQSKVRCSSSSLSESSSMDISVHASPYLFTTVQCLWLPYIMLDGIYIM